MSSARELLEQADALMQRNRRPPRDDEIPELTDAVPDDALPHARTEAAGARAATLAPPSVDDIPELTEAVEEIEAPSIQDYPDDPDELSRWLQEDEPKIAPRAREAPAMVPAQEAPRAVAAIVSQMPDRLPDAMLRAETRAEPDAEERAGTAPPMTPFTAPWPPPADVAATGAPEEIFFDDVPVPASTGEDNEGETIDTGLAESVDGIEALVPTGRNVSEGGAIAPEATTNADEVEAIVPAAAEGVDEFEATAPAANVDVHEPESPVPAATPVLEPEAFVARDEIPTPAPQSPQPALAAAADDPERWNALAEEIRMQVLQRIDIFTDTGLREQLTARLQPVVDRASADLVATINREVGQMLRAYVAEAIEREIERWRHGGA